MIATGTSQQIPLQSSGSSPSYPPRTSSLTSYLGLLRESKDVYPFTPFEIYLTTCKNASGASPATKRKWRKVLGIGEIQ
jgi:hypothetical protein